MAIYLERYSENGFIPQYQSNHLKQNEFLLMDDNEYKDWLMNNMGYINNYQMNVLLKIKRDKEDFYRAHINDFKYGIWCFIKGKGNNFELNHLYNTNKKITDPMNQVKKNIGFVKEIDIPNFICYNCNLDNIGTIIDFKITYNGNSGFYVPERSIQYIHEIK